MPMFLMYIDIYRRSKSCVFWFRRGIRNVKCVSLYTDLGDVRRFMNENKKRITGIDKTKFVSRIMFEK